MPLVQDRTLDLLTSSPVRYYCTLDTPYYPISEPLGICRSLLTDLVLKDALMYISKLPLTQDVPKLHSAPADLIVLA